jgi:hypothetical protein
MTTVSILNQVTRVAINNERREIVITPRVTQVTIKPFGPQGAKGDKGEDGITPDLSNLTFDGGFF